MIQKKQSILKGFRGQKYDIVILLIILIYISNSCTLGIIKYYLGVNNETFT